MPDVRSLTARWQALGLTYDCSSLLVRWQEEHRRYHDLRHLAEMLTTLDLLGAPSREVRLAAWYHDAVYEPRAADNEERSADLARQELSGADVDAAHVARLVLLTRTHHVTDGDLDGAQLSDADLAVLARPPGPYGDYVVGIRAEYGHLNDSGFQRGRRQVLESLLARPHVYATPYGRARWEAAARDNLTAELAAL